MRYILPFVFLLWSCNSHRQDSPRVQDSVVVQVDSVISTGEEADGAASYGIDDKVKQMSFSVGGKAYNAQELLAITFAPDQFDDEDLAGDETFTQYMVTDAASMEGNFFISENSCEVRDLLLTKRMEIDAEYYDLFFLAQDVNGRLHVSDKLSLEGSQGQSETDVEVVTEGISTHNRCYALRVSSSTEGGDINFHRDSWVEYFIADPKGFHSVIRILLEETDVQDYEVTQDERKDSASEISSYNVLSTSTHGLFDIAVHTIVKQNDVVISESDRTFRFNGHHYE